MIKIKHLLDTVEPDDGQRISVEPINLTRDLREWCKVDHVLCHLGPPKALWEWFEEHPDGYDYFRGKYHQDLSRSTYKQALRNLAKAAAKENLTLIHVGDDSHHNTATALYEYLSELGAWSTQQEG